MKNWVSHILFLRKRGLIDNLAALKRRLFAPHIRTMSYIGSYPPPSPRAFDGSFASSGLRKLVNTWSRFAGMLFCCTKLSVKLLSELRYQDMISVQYNVNNLLPNVAFSNAILSHENCMSQAMSILSGKYTYPFFFDSFVKNEFCNRSINSMDWLNSNSVTFCIEQPHQVFKSVCLV